MEVAVSEAAVSVCKTSETSMQWLALALTPGLGPTKARRVIEFFGSVQAVFRASLTELEAAGLRAVSAQSLGTGRSMELAHDELGKAAVAGARIVALDDPGYPTQLKEIYDPPLVLYVRGNEAVISCPGIAIVGTRHPTPYGMGMAERLSCDLAARGLVIFSGMARGVDTFGHKGAIKAKGKTVAVFGTGVDVIYPRENKKIAEGILECGGALISEFPLESFAAPQHFPIRNRIISGLSLGVLVVEAGEYSGTRITARCALEQSREIFAVPGNVISRNSWGPNTLIKQGAKLTATWEDVWEELPVAIQQELEHERQAAASDKGPQTGNLFVEPKLSPGEKKVLSLLKEHESTHIDEIIEKLESQLSSSEIFTILFELELNGKVRQMPGKNYVKSF